MRTRRTSRVIDDGSTVTGQDVTGQDVVEGDVVDNRVVGRAAPIWSPAQIVGLAGGIAFVILGIAALARTGFDSSHLYRPHAVVWHLSHSPLLGAIEIAFGALLILASVVPGGLRSMMALLGAIALGFGLVVLLDVAPHRLFHWLGVTHRNGSLFVIAGAVILVAALFSPVFGGTERRRRVHEHTRHERVPAVDGPVATS